MEKKENKGRCYCRSDRRGKGLKKRTSSLYCSACNLHKRGKNHDEGSHHKTAERKLKALVS